MTLYNKKKYAWQRKCIVFAILCCVVSIFYYSWLPKGRLGKETYLPLWFLNWSNTYFNLRTAIPFTALGFLLETCDSITDKSLSGKSTLPFWAINIGIGSVIVCLAEGGQFFILDRHPDLRDVAFGILGSICGSILYYFTKKIIKLFLSKNA